MHASAMGRSRAAAGFIGGCKEGTDSTCNPAQDITVRSAGAATRPGTFAGPKVILCTTTALTIA